MTINVSGRLLVPDGARGRGDSSRASIAYEALLAKIRSRELLPGTRLREEEVAAMVGMSRTPVREALTRLQARGLVQNTQNGLAIVELGRSEIMQLYGMRSVLEGAAALFAAENASSTDRGSLELSLRKFEDYNGDAAGFAELNRRLHTTIYEAAHNVYLLRALGELHDSRALLPDTTFSLHSRPEIAKVEHRRIVNAVVARRPADAEAAARDHIDKARDTRLKMLFDEA